jgi:hypothetical protein
VKISIKSKNPIDQATHEKLLADLNKVYSESNKEFAAKMKDLKIDVPEAGDPDQWFKAGYGRSVEEAAIAARKARQESGSKIMDYTSPEVRDSINTKLSSVEEKRQALESSKQFAPLMEKAGNGVNLPREDVFDLVRKNDSPADLAQAVSQRYNLKSFSAADAAKLQDYVEGVDEFSPTILIAKRETVNLDAAGSGGLTADFLGMGSANLKATAAGIAKKPSVEQALAGAREGEKQVTATFKKRMEEFKKVVGDANCTGDDCAMAKVLSDNQKVKIMQDLAKNPETRGVRMSFIGENVSTESRMQLASHGESIEKVFRKELEGKVPYDRLQKMIFGFDMKTTELGEGQVNLIVGKSYGSGLSAQEQKAMQDAFSKAVEKTNEAKSTAYAQGTGTFTKTQMYLRPGVGIVVIEADKEDKP